MNWESRVCPSGTSLVQERDSGPFCRTHVPSPPEQRNLWEPEPDGSAPWPVIFPAIAWTLSMSKKITTLPGNLFHCWTPLVTRKDDHKIWVRKFCLLSIFPLSLSITFIFLQLQALPVFFLLLSTQGPLFLVVFFSFKSELLLDFCFPQLFIQVSDTPFWVHCWCLSYHHDCGFIKKAELAGALCAANLFLTTSLLFILIEMIHNCIQNFIFQVFQPFKP